jgi:hypothetical protein
MDLLTVQEVAADLRVSPDTVRRMFREEPEVVRICNPIVIGKRKHKPHVRLRIPASLLARYKQDRSAAAALEVQRGRRRVE